MKGIFYCQSVPCIGLLQEYIPVSQALSEEQVAAPLANAYDMFIRPLIGDSLADHFRDLTKKEEEERYAPTEEEKKVLELMRTATANLAFWYSFTELNTHITDQGFQRQEGETFKPIFRYQELELKQQLRNKGFNALDKMLRYMQENPDNFNGFKESEAWTDIAHALVRGPKEIDDFCYINGSYLVYLKLKPSFKRIMEIFIEPTLGEGLCNALNEWLKNGTVPNGVTDELMKKLREKVVPVVVCKALSEHVRNVGEITDRGLYYTNIQTNANENQATLLGSDSERARQAAHLYSTAMHYHHRLIRWVEEYMPSMFKGHPEDAFNRDNDNKHTFWA